MTFTWWLIHFHAKAQRTQAREEFKGFSTHLQSLQGYESCDGEAIDNVLFGRRRFLSLSSWGSGAGWGRLPVTLPLWVGGEAKDRALNMIVSYPIWSPLSIPHWPRLPLLAEATRSRAIHVLHRKAPDKASSHRESNCSRAQHWQHLTSAPVKTPTPRRISTISKGMLSVY